MPISYRNSRASSYRFDSLPFQILETLKLDSPAPPGPSGGGLQVGSENVTRLTIRKATGDWGSRSGSSDPLCYTFDPFDFEEERVRCAEPL